MIVGMFMLFTFSLVDTWFISFLERLTHRNQLYLSNHIYGDQSGYRSGDRRCRGCRQVPRQFSF